MRMFRNYRTSIVVNMLGAPESLALKGCILWYVDFMSIFNSLMELKLRAVPNRADNGALCRARAGLLTAASQTQVLARVQ